MTAWAILVEALLVWPSPPSLPSPFGSVGLDTVAHAVLFGVLAALAGRALREEVRPWWWALVGALAFAAFTEFEQHFIPTRSMEMGDFLADTAGAAFGLVLFAVLAPRRREPDR